MLQISSLNESLAAKATTTALNAVDAKLGLSQFSQVSFAPTIENNNVTRLNFTFKYASGSYYELKFFTASTKQIVLDYVSSTGTFSRVWSGTLN